MKVDIVSFDLDGTLVHTAPLIAGAANRALQAHGITPRGVGEIAALIGNGGQELMLKLLARVFIEQPSVAEGIRAESVLDAFDAELARGLDGTVAAYPGVAVSLAGLKAAGVKLACTTNKESRAARRVLRSAKLDHLFKLVVGGDTLPQKKPHASVLRHVVQTLGGDVRRAAHVGDSFIDVESARNAGVAAWAVPYGYNGGRPIADAKPDRIFASVNAVAEHVLAGHSRRSVAEHAAPPASPPL